MRQASAPGRRGVPPSVAALLAVAGVVALGFWLSVGRQPVTEENTQPAGVPKAGAPDPQAGFQKLAGRWLRPDGGYVMEIKTPQDNGKLEAAYFNPDPIHVARAEASWQDSTLKAFIELRDVNYPGSTYRLSYDPGNDRLTGTYFQAVARETYEVFFVRMKP